jgi:hypothetical protein
MFLRASDKADLAPAAAEDVQRTLEAALIYYSGHPRRRAKFTEADGLKVQITAGHLAKELAEAGFVIMRKPPGQQGFSHLMDGTRRRDEN